MPTIYDAGDNNGDDCLGRLLGVRALEEADELRRTTGSDLNRTRLSSGTRQREKSAREHGPQRAHAALLIMATSAATSTMRVLSHVSSTE